MTDAELTLRLRETLSAAQRRYRTARGMGCIVTPRIPDLLLDELAAGLAPVLRALVADAVAQQVTR
jgi:ABC-type branched-subunit amino acid transport system ATPase component